MISVVIPVYNQANKLAQCLNSLKAQSFRDYEVIIVVDGATDQSLSVANRFAENEESKIRVISQKNLGANSARNAGARLTQGEYIIFCDADITLTSQMLETMQAVLNDHPEVSYVYSSFRYGKKIFRLWPFDIERLKTMPYIHTTSLIRRKDFPGFDESILRLQDWDLWLTMLKNGRVGYWIDRVLFTVQTGGTMSKWLPSFAYQWLPFLPAVKKYNYALAAIKNKHGI